MCITVASFHIFSDSSFAVVAHSLLCVTNLVGTALLNVLRTSQTCSCIFWDLSVSVPPRSLPVVHCPLHHMDSEHVITNVIDFVLLVQCYVRLSIVYVMKEWICYITKYLMSIFFTRVTFIKLQILCYDFNYRLEVDHTRNVNTFP
jgi:hypothetical protein